MTVPALTTVKAWSPFKIDALGLITLLGADAIRKTLGQLVYSPWEYFPLLAGHIFADDSIADPIPGFVLYNVTEGVVATDLSAWFTRWLLCQDLTSCSTVLKIRHAGHQDKRPATAYSMVGFAVLLNTILVVMPALMGDWYGFASSISLITLVAIRLYVLMASRDCLDAYADRASATTKTKSVKLFIKLPSGSCVSAYTTTGITQDCLLTEARPISKEHHRIARCICWVAFGVHAVTLGMACLAMQLLLVTLTLAFSVAAVQGWMSEGSKTNTARIGSRIIIEQHVLKTAGKRAETYVSMELTKDEEQSMVDWFIMPRPSNKIWWDAFAKFKEDFRKNPGATKPWEERMQVGHGA